LAEGNVETGDSTERGPRAGDPRRARKELAERIGLLAITETIVAEETILRGDVRYSTLRLFPLLLGQELVDI
jgi:hypothetical protein